MYLSKHNKQVFVLFCSSIAGLLFGVLSSVINTRALDPALYGDVRYVQNIIQFISSLLLFGYFVSGSRLLALSKDEAYSRRIRGIMCAILGGSILFTMAVMAILALFSITAETTNMTSLYLVSIPVCGNVLMLNYINTVSQGDNHIGRISIARLLPTALYCAVAYFIYKHFTATPVLMLLLFNGIAVITLGATILSTRPSFKNLKESFHLLNEENKAYGWNVYIGSIVTVSTGYISGITLGWFCDTNAEVGFFTLAYTLAAPLTMLPSIIGTTYFKRFASQNKIDRKILYGSVLLTILSFVVFVFMIEIVVGILYNDKYASVSFYASLLAIGTSIHGIADVINRFLGAHGQGKMLRNSSFASGTIITLGSFVLVYYFNIYGAIATRVLGSFIYLITMVYYYRKFIKV